VNYRQPTKDDMWATCPRSASSDYHTEFHEGCYQKHTNPFNFRTSNPDISDYHANFAKDTALSEHGRSSAWHV
jgi:hypothetical protein